MNNKEQLLKYVPKHKLDNYYIDKLLELSNNDFLLITNELLVWLKNMHFPVSKEVAVVLSKRHNTIKNILIKDLSDPLVDAVWKYNIIAYVISNFKLEEQKMYIDTLTRLVEEPTKEEIYAESNLIAKQLLLKLK